MPVVIARWALLLLTGLLAAIWVPAGLDAILDLRVVRSIALFSPVTRNFVFREYVPSWQEAGLPATETVGLEHGLIHRAANGQAISREAFENALPFQYAESLRVRGLLPATIGDRPFDADALRQGRLILGIRPADVGAARLDPGLHALLDARPDRVNLVFPEDRFRLRGSLEFVNADHNAPDPAVSQAVNAALAAAGFVFPARAAYGRDTILKPWDAGWFLTDDAGALFRLRRLYDAPLVERVPLPAGTRVAHVQVQEAPGRQAAGLLVAADHTVHLLRADLSLRPLPCQGYDPARHWLKVVIDPFGDTCIFDDNAAIAAVYRPADGSDAVRTARAVPSAAIGPGAALSWLIMPLRLTLAPETTAYIAPAVTSGGVWSVAGAGLWGLVGAGVWWRRSKRG
ncbi:DUF4857 domain-containing protein [Solidesulfovibrio sp.]